MLNLAQTVPGSAGACQRVLQSQCTACFTAHVDGCYFYVQAGRLLFCVHVCNDAGPLRPVAPALQDYVI